nr:syntaxin-related protein KNOLLE [Tanacetum cinerariifolium]
MVVMMETQGEQMDDIENHVINAAHYVNDGTKNLKMEHGRGKVLETMVEIQDYYDVAKEMKMSLLELYQVFLNMVVMMETQGEQMDDIEHHVINAAHYVNDGTKNLKMVIVVSSSGPTVTSNWAVCCTLNPPIFSPIPPEGVKVPGGT